MMIGETKLGYKITELVGQGGFGTVYRAVKKNKAMETVRALKHISLPSRKEWTDIYNSMGNDMAKTDAYFDTILQEILNEIRILADLTSKGVKNVVWYYENEIEDTPSPKHYDIYLLMEFLTSLPSYIETHEIKVKDVIKIGIDILSALVECHKRNIIHRDIKTDNIFMSEDGDYKLGDFGVSKKLSDRSRATSMKGTPNYIAPEVYLGQEYNETVDLYSLGIVLYRLLNYNRNPFMPNYPESYNSEDEDKAFELRMKGDLPSYPAFGGGVLGDVILKSISDKDNRFQSAAEFKAALESASQSMTKEELEVVVLENMLSGVDFSTFGSKNDLTQMANSNSTGNSSNVVYNNNPNPVSDGAKEVAKKVEEKKVKKTPVLPIVILAVLLVCVGAFFVLKNGIPITKGKVVNDWYTASDGKEYYYDQNGVMYKNTAKNINGDTYFFDETGAKVVNDWYLYDNNYYYVDANGKMLKNAFKDVSAAERYYLGSDGKMLKSTFFDIAGETYYFESDGKMKIDSLVQVGSSLYYAQVTGAIKKNGWCINDQFYADSEGKILMNTTTPDGVKVDATGRRVQSAPAISVPPAQQNQQTQQTQQNNVASTRAANSYSANPSITNGAVVWGDHLVYTEKVYLDEYGEEGGTGKISIDITKLREDGTQQVLDVNEALKKVFDDGCDRAQWELPYKYFEMENTALSTSNDNELVIVVTGDIKYLDNQIEKMRYKVVLDKVHGTVNYEKVR